MLNPPLIVYENGASLQELPDKSQISGKSKNTKYFTETTRVVYSV